MLKTLKLCQLSMLETLQMYELSVLETLQVNMYQLSILESMLETMQINMSVSVINSRFSARNNAN